MTTAAETDQTEPTLENVGRRSGRWAIVTAVTILLTIALLVAWNNGLGGVFVAKNFGVVEPGRLYRSGQISRWQIGRALSDNHIRVIVALSGHGGPAADVAAEAVVAGRRGVRREVFPLGGDGTGQVEQYVGAVAAIARAERAGEPVLVHCIAGAQRTGGVVAVYEMLVEHRPAAEAFAEMRRYGHDPSVNPRLTAYLDDHMGEIAAGLKRAGVIDRVPDPLPTLPRD